MGKEKIIDWEFARTGEVIDHPENQYGKYVRVKWHDCQYETLNSRQLRQKWYEKKRYEIVEIEH